jgi:hypothetical protein
MKRSVGITVIAVLSLIGSILVLLMGILMLVIMAIVPSPHSAASPFSPAVFKVVMLLAAMLYVLPAIWGIATSVGLFRLSNWARISIIVFSVLLVLMSGLTALTTLVIPMPSTGNGYDSATTFAIRSVMVIVWLALLAIGVWWLVFFNRARVKQQFTTAATPLSSAPEGMIAVQQSEGSFSPPASTLAPARPLSFTIIAWLLLAGCLFMPVGLFLHSPAIFLTRILTGWTAVLLYGLFFAINLFVGIGLLRFKLLAREIAIGYFAFAFVNTAVFYLAPGGQGRMVSLLSIQGNMFPWMAALQNSSGLGIDPTPMFRLMSVVGLLPIPVILYFLITRKRAFEKAASAKAAANA